MKRFSLLVLGSVLALTLLAAAFAGGVAVSQLLDVPGMFGVAQQDSSLGEKIEEVERLIDRGALEPSNEDSKTAGAISGLLMSLGDPYSAYFDAEDFEYFNEQNDGEFYGIGVTIAEREGVVYVVSVIEDTPAAASGLEPDDEFVAIDGEVNSAWTLDEVVSRVRGPEGTTVDVQMHRPDPEDPEADGELLDVTIERAKVEIPNVMAHMNGDDVGYLRLLSFNSHSAGELREKIEELEEDGAQGFVLDVRDNPGGLLQSSVDVASLFIDDGVIVRVEERDRPQSVDRASGDTATDLPLVVLMNGNSASASEVLAGALQDYDRASLVGEKSFGKGSVQTVERLSFGGGVKYTIAHYLTPLSREINGVGLTPDVPVEMAPELQADEETDTQLRKALQVLRESLP